MTQVVDSLSKRFRIDQRPEKHRKDLSNRELEVVALVAVGHRNKEIANKLFISEQTVKTHLTNIFQKLQVRIAWNWLSMPSATDWVDSANLKG